MKVPENGVPVEFNNQTILDGYELTFDQGESAEWELVFMHGAWF